MGVVGRHCGVPPPGLVLWWMRRGVGREQLVSGEDGYQALEIVDAIYRSCRTGEKVALA